MFNSHLFLTDKSSRNSTKLELSIADYILSHDDISFASFSDIKKKNLSLVLEWI